MRGGIEEMAREIVTGIKTPRGSRTGRRKTVTIAVHAAGTTVAEAVTERPTMNAVTGSQDIETTRTIERDVTAVTAVAKVADRIVTTVGTVTALPVTITRSHDRVDRHYRTTTALLAEV